MNKIPRLVSQFCSKFIPDSKLFRSPTPVFLPFYHVVSDKKLPHILNYYYRNQHRFEKELDFILKFFKPVSLDYLLENPLPKEKVFHLSFDDGLKECAEIIAPVLLRKGIPATFFINSGFVNNGKLFHRYKASLVFSELQKTPNKKVENLLVENRIPKKEILSIPENLTSVLNEAANLLHLDFDEFLKKENPYLSTQQILQLKNNGFTLGGHSENHPEFWTITLENQLLEIKKSMYWLNENIQPKIRAFSFPFTDDGISAELFRKIKEENICDITFGTAGLKNDQIENHFQRYPVEIPGNFRQNLKTEFVYFWLRKLIGKSTVQH